MIRRIYEGKGEKKMKQKKRQGGGGEGGDRCDRMGRIFTVG